MKLEILGIDFVQTLMLHNGYLTWIHIDIEMRHTKLHFFWQTLLNCGLSIRRQGKIQINCAHHAYQLCRNFKYPTRLLHAFSAPLLCMICKPSLNSKDKKSCELEKKDRKRKKFKKKMLLHTRCDCFCYSTYLLIHFFLHCKREDTIHHCSIISCKQCW